MKKNSVNALKDLLESRATFLDLFRRMPRRQGSPTLEPVDPSNRYKILRKLGEGASGVVYQAWDRTIKRHLALKVSRMPSEEVIEEGRLAGRLRHPNIVGVLNASKEGDLHTITMEFVQGPNLKKFGDVRNLLPLTRVVEIALGVCNGLEHAHGRGIIHRDIKPANILLDGDGNPKITDFGIAHRMGKTIRAGLFGTPEYMSPEVLRDAPVTAKSDIFSLGCVLYELISGKSAFQGSNCFTSIYRVIHESPPALSEIRPDVPGRLDRIVMKCLSKDPEHRYGSCAEMARDLRAALRRLGGGVPGKKLGSLVDSVNRLPFFQTFPREQVERLIAASNIVKVRAKGVILEEGDINDTFYVLLRGRAAVRKGGRKIAFVEEGECFGEMAWIAGQPRAADIVAERECILLKIKAPVLDEASESVQLLFYRTFAATLVRRLSKATNECDALEGVRGRPAMRAG